MKITTVTGINRPIYSNSIERALKKDRNANGTRSFNQALALSSDSLYLCALWLCRAAIHTDLFRSISFLFDEIFMKLKINNNMRSGPMPLTPYLPL